MGIKNKSESQLLSHFKSDDIATILGIYQLRLTFSSTEQSSYGYFIEFCSSAMTEQKCSAAATETASHSDSSLWFDLRYGRITASTLYDVAHCKKNDGVLVQQILGVSKFKATLAMNRGKQLEEDVIRCVETKFRVKLN
nr:unnamed protein product [Callosobruchus chinensis]